MPKKIILTIAEALLLYSLIVAMIIYKVGTDTLKRVLSQLFGIDI